MSVRKRKTPWRCFHCDDVFTNERDAAEHFGGSLMALAACQIKGHEHNLIAKIRAQELLLDTYRAADSQVLRAMESMRSEHVTALRTMEETGYGRAVIDMQKLAVLQFGKEIAT